MKSVICILDPAKCILKSYAENLKETEKLLKRYKNVLLSRKEAITISGLSVSTFDKKVRDPLIIIYDAKGKPFFRIDDIVKIRMLTIETSPSILCINTIYHFDENRDGYITFDGGENYKKIDENKELVYLYSDRWKAIVKMDRKIFEDNFLIHNL